MATKAIKRKRDDRPLGDREWKGIAERAPSIVRTEQMVPIRWVALVSLMLAAVGGMALVMAAYGRPYLIGPSGGLILFLFGVAGLLFHAFSEKELIYRRIYGAAGAALLGCGVLFSILKTEAGFGGLFLTVGAPCLGAALCLLVSFARNETEELFRLWTVRILGIAGALMVLVGVLGGILSEEFLLGRGVVYLVLALLYVAAYISLHSISSTAGYWAGFALGVAGVLMMVVGLGKALPFENLPFVGSYLGWINDVFRFVRWPTGNPGAPFLFTYLGLEFLLLSVGVCSDSALVAMVRRELAAYFYSPIAYVVLVALGFVAWVAFYFFVSQLLFYSSMPQGLPEPILQHFFFDFFPVVCVVLMVPIITMRLFSEESRSGTLEVLLTAPVRESTVVLSKFLAAFRFFLLAWYPWGIYLIALYAEGAEKFDYRPALTFAIVLAATGAGFVAMGLFFSSLTRSQIGAAILTLMAMIALLAPFFIKFLSRTSTFWTNFLTYISFLDLWRQASTGVIAPRYLLFHISVAAFFLFVTVKVLESRKWR